MAVNPFSNGVQKSWVAATATEVLLEYILAELQTISGNTADLSNVEALLTAIELDTSSIETLITSGNATQDDILAELQTQTGIMNTHTTALNTISASLTTINTSIQTADANNVAELQAIQTDLASVITELQAIGANTAPLAAASAAIEAAINSMAGDVDTDLNAIQAQLTTANTSLNTMITNLTTISATLTLINGQYTGTVGITKADISGNGAYVTAAATYNSVQLIVTAGSVTEGGVTYPIGVWPVSAPQNKVLPSFTFNATGATAAVELMTP